jgi:hypothetical protein
MYVHNMDGTHKDKATWTKEKESTKEDGRLEALYSTHAADRMNNAM